MAEKREIRIAEHPDRVSSYFRLEKGTLAVITVSGILYNIGMTAGPYFEGKLAQYLFDVINKNKTFYDMLFLALTYVSVILLVQGMRYIKRFYVRRFANNTNRNMKHVLYKSLVYKSKPEMEQENVGNMMTKAVSDVDACVEGMRKFTTEVFDTGVVLVAYLVMLFCYDWRLAFLSCLFPPFAYLIAQKLKKLVYRFTAAYKESSGKLNGATLDRVSGEVTYRVFGCEQSRNAAYEERLADYEKKAVKANVWENTMQPIYQIVSMVSVLFIIWFGSKNVLGTGWTAWNIAAFTTFLSCFSKLAVKSSSAAKLFNAVQKAQVSWKRIKPMMREAARKEYKNTSDNRNIPGHLSVSKLSFTYPDGKTFIRGLSFDAFPGQIIGVTGPVASGKSTLGKVFLCEYPYDGSIRIGDRELSALTEAERSEVLAYMGHHPELMSDTVEENIRLGNASDPDTYLRAVCLDREIGEMPEGTQTRVGSGGVRLSGGQQARVALARTLYHRRKLLILDDPFSAVDRRTEQEIMLNLRQIAKDSIIILISHRLYLFPDFDRVIWMENGQAMVGTHKSLMETNAEYAHLYRTQVGGDSDEA